MRADAVRRVAEVAMLMFACVAPRFAPAVTPAGSSVAIEY